MVQTVLQEDLIQDPHNWLQIPQGDVSWNVWHEAVLLCDNVLIDCVAM